MDDNNSTLEDQLIADMRHQKLSEILRQQRELRQLIEDAPARYERTEPRLGEWARSRLGDWAMLLGALAHVFAGAESDQEEMKRSEEKNLSDMTLEELEAIVQNKRNNEMRQLGEQISSLEDELERTHRELEDACVSRW